MARKREMSAEVKKDVALRRRYHKPIVSVVRLDKVVRAGGSGAVDNNRPFTQQP